MKNRSAETRTRAVQSAKVKHTHDTEFSKEKERRMMKESLLMPMTSVGKTTSASICEKSNEWSEHRLDKKKSELDQKLYKTMVKLNSDKLELISELAHLRKSASTGNLETHFKGTHGTDQLTSGKDYINASLRKNSVQISPAVATKFRHGGDSGKKTFSPGRKDVHRKIVKKSENSAKIAIIIGSDSSSDEFESVDTCSTDKMEAAMKPEHMNEACDHSGHQNTLSLTPSLRYSGCLADRSQSQMVENVTRRFAKQLSAKTRTDK